MQKFDLYVDRILSNTEKILANNAKISLSEFLEVDKSIREDAIKSRKFFSFEYLRNTFKLDKLSWICILISILNEINNKNKINPIEKTIEICLRNKPKSEIYTKKQILESKAFSLFLKKDFRIDEYILDFLMTNGNSRISSREFTNYFPSDLKIERESDAKSLANICKLSMYSLYFKIDGKEGEGKKTFVRRIASICSKALIIVDLEKCLNSESDFSQVITYALRQSMLLQGMICFDKVDLLGAMVRKLEFIFNSSKNFCRNSFFLFNNNTNFCLQKYIKDTTVIEYLLQKLDTKQTYNIWREKFERLNIDKSIKLQEISNIYKLTPGQIDEVSKCIFSDKICNFKITRKSILNSIQRIMQSSFGEKAQLVKTENSWDDLIIPAKDKQMIMDICKQIKLKGLVFEDWKLSDRIDYGQGLSFLFSGPPGTGKTMAASVISNEIGLELYRVDLSRLVSKYIGETEKNLSDLFDEAEKSNSILLFDETDAIFSQRTSVKDSKDRGANLEISYLLQKMETHNGICIMTTNYIENIDKAFFRRISYVFHFPNPNKNDRQKIWKSMFGKYVPLDDEIDFDFLSKFDISGGNIKNIVVSSCLKAAQEQLKVNMKHIVTSIEYELKKQGYTPIRSDFGEYSYLI